jgi:hypothetical protein
MAAISFMRLPSANPGLKAERSSGSLGKYAHRPTDKLCALCLSVGEPTPFRITVRDQHL